MGNSRHDVRLDAHTKTGLNVGNRGACSATVGFHGVPGSLRRERCKHSRLNIVCARQRPDNVERRLFVPMLLVEAQRPSESAAIVVDQKVAKIVAGAASEELKLKSAIIDGELVYPHKSGLSNFHPLQAVVRSQPDRRLFMAFDLMQLGWHDLRDEPCQERRGRLEALIRPGGRIQYSDSLEGTPGELFSAAERFGLEGIVCKRRGSPYRS